jgi:serine/threonine kinase 32
MYLYAASIILNDYYRTGGDLRSHINDNREHDENTIKFWIAELICAVKYLHSQGIVHR